jgi:hypothetical protein
LPYFFFAFFRSFLWLSFLTINGFFVPQKCGFFFFLPSVFDAVLVEHEVTAAAAADHRRRVNELLQLSLTLEEAMLLLRERVAMAAVGLTVANGGPDGVAATKKNK